MSKPGGPSGAASGPTAAAAAAASQKQNSLINRVETDVAAMIDNFTQLVQLSRVNDPPVRNSQDSFQMEIRAARIVQAADSLLKLVSELKQTAIFTGFASLNEHVDRQAAEFEQQAEHSDRLLEKVAEQASAGLKELETHYYASVMRSAAYEHLQ